MAEFEFGLEEVGLQPVLLLSAAPRGARLARRLAGPQLAAWGIPHGCALAEDVELVVGELAANAVLHGRVPGRDFEIRLGYDGLRVRVEGSNARGDRIPPPEPPAVDPWSAEHGRGLALVQAVAREWGVAPRGRAAPGRRSGRVCDPVPACPPRPQGPLTWARGERRRDSSPS
ncbi:ATP-binding protein [Streptomyces sp. H27-H1]|uniref:ATP-binding protein n=1 Tax=Streptomyces sp. H27-H1 TaxID=2996461 RepID=UPI002D1E44EE|nr:ATP-binding protein [Streptomyces sp. H27-H1]